MHRITRWTSTTAAMLAAAMLIAACGSSSSTTKSTPTATIKGVAATTATPQPSSVTTSAIGTLKTQDGVLITGTGDRTLYYFKPDKKTTSAHAKSSTCYGPCANVWPPVLATGTPTAGGSANSSLIGITKRKDGTTQVTYNGLPLYYYAADTKPNQVTGNHLKDGFGFWGALLASGRDTPSS